METRLDPITIEMLWNRLISIVEEADAAVQRTAFSSLVRDGHDYSCTLFERRGMLLAQGAYVAPGHLGGVTRLAKRIAEDYFSNGEDLEEGDTLITNDPWLLSGHLPDVGVITPIFYHGKLVAFGASIFHHVDIGGALDSMRREVYEEGLQIPLLKLYKKNIPNEEIFQMLRANVRVPDQVIGDLMSQIAANHIISTRVKELLSEQQMRDLDALSDRIMEHTERAMRKAIEKIPDGVYAYQGEIERPGPGAEAVKVNLGLEVKGSCIKADFTGSSPQVPEGVNCVFNYTFGFFIFAMKSILDPHIPNNDGCIRPLEVLAPQGCIFNCTHPSAVVGRTSIGTNIPAMVYEALTPVIPHRVIAESGASPVWWLTFAGRKYDGPPFVVAPLLGAGLGARSSKDGVVCFFPPNNSNLPV